jgi:hypothetical protein
MHQQYNCMYCNKRLKKVNFLASSGGVPTTTLLYLLAVFFQLIKRTRTCLLQKHPSPRSSSFSSPSNSLHQKSRRDPLSEKYNKHFSGCQSSRFSRSTPFPSSHKAAFTAQTSSDSPEPLFFLRTTRPRKVGTLEIFCYNTHISFPNIMY